MSKWCKMLSACDRQGRMTVSDAVISVIISLPTELGYSDQTTVFYYMHRLKL